MGSDYEIFETLPRCMRLPATSVHYEPVVYSREIVVEIPVYDEVTKKPVQVYLSKNVVPASEVMSKYKEEDFDIINLIEAGVPLSLVNIERSSNKSIEEISEIASRLNSLEDYSKMVDERKAAERAWFKLDDVEPNK